MAFFKHKFCLLFLVVVRICVFKKSHEIASILQHSPLFFAFTIAMPKTYFAHLDAATVYNTASTPSGNCSEQESGEGDFWIVDDILGLLQTNLTSEQIDQVTDELKKIGISDGAVQRIHAILGKYFTSDDSNRHRGMVRNCDSCNIVLQWEKLRTVQNVILTSFSLSCLLSSSQSITSTAPCRTETRRCVRCWKDFSAGFSWYSEKAPALCCVDWAMRWAMKSHG